MCMPVYIRLSEHTCSFNKHFHQAKYVFMCASVCVLCVSYTSVCVCVCVSVCLCVYKCVRTCLHVCEVALNHTSPLLLFLCCCFSFDYKCQIHKIVK